MQLTCPNCGKPVQAENINIQRMAAVCPSCHAVFQFDPSASRIKRRKVKQPQQLTTEELDSRLNIAFRTNFRLDSNEEFLASAFLSVVFTFITLILINKHLVDPVPLLIPLGFGLLTLFLYYWLALVVFNKTHIEISDESIKVSRKPIPNILTAANTISLAGIESIRYEETMASREHGYDTPRYNVWAETVDGSRKLIVGDVIEDYAVFISQRLNEQLDLDAPDTSRLLEPETEAESEQSADPLNTPSESSRTRS